MKLTISETGLIFLNGAGLSSAIWKDLLPLIDFPVLALDYPNRGKGQKINAKLALRDYFSELVDQTQNFNCKKIIIVAHSIGGCPGLMLARHLEDRCAGFIAISAAIPQHGDSFLSCFPFPKNTVMNLMMTLLGTKPPDGAIKKDLCNDLSEIQSKEIVACFTTESKKLYSEKCQAKVPDCKTLYIQCSNDKGFPFSLQTKMSENLRAKEIKTLKSGHLPMLSMPKELAKLINDFATL